QAGQPWANHSSAVNMMPKHPAASSKTTLATLGHGNNAAPNSVSGKATKLSQGTAKILATGPIMLTGKLKANKNGAKPMAAIHCVRPIICHQRQRPKRAENANTNAPTAVNDNQNPACNTTSGSCTKTRI